MRVVSSLAICGHYSSPQSQETSFSFVPVKGPEVTPTQY